MATPKQCAANRANAEKSTGPRTPEGKATSSRNANAYGFNSKSHFIKGEDPDEFHALESDLLAELKPRTHVELILVEKMIHNQWLSIRAIRLQSELLVTREPWQDIPKDLGLLIRYQAAADRAFHKCHAELLKLQKEREKSENGFVREAAAVTPGTTIKTPEQAPAVEPVPPVPAPEPVEIVMEEQKISPHVPELRLAA